MTLFSGQTTQMLQGVSQQHPKDRAEGQNTAQLNCISDIVEGLRRRPAVKTLAKLANIDVGFYLDANTAVYSYSRGDGTEEYIMLFDTSGRIKVYDALTGSEQTMTNNTATYLTTTTPNDSLRFHTIGDSTFVLNTEKTISMTDTDKAPALPYDALVYCVRASYGHTYRIKVDGAVVAECTTPSTVTISASLANKQSTLSSVDIINALKAGTNPGGWTITKNLDADAPGTFSYSWRGDVLYMLNTVDFDITVEDGNHGNDIKGIKHSVKAFEELPKYARNEYKIEISGTGDERFDNYWVKWLPDAADPGANWDSPGKWQECVAPDTQVDLDPTTMPVLVTRESLGVFESNPNEWVGRAAGDDDTNPDASFVGNVALDIGSFQNRLYMLTGENVVMTRSFDQLAFFAESVAAPADDDPIDSASSDNQVTDLLHSAIFNGSLVLFSNNAQFIHAKDEPVTPATFGVSSDTKFNVSPNVKPVVTGTNIMFPTDFGDFTNVWEYNLNTLTGSPQCESTTKHIPRYIEGNPIQMVANTTTDYVFVRTDELPTCIYVMQFYMKEQKRAQLSWHKWDFPTRDNIVSMTLLNQRLYLVTEDSAGDVYLEYMDLSLPLTDNSNFELYLDHYSTEQVTIGTYTVNGKDYTARVSLAETGITSFVYGTGATNEGFLITDYEIDSGYVYCNEAPAGSYIIQGYPYDSSGVLTNPYVKDSEGRAYTKRTIIDEVTINAQNTGYCKFTIGHAAGVDYDQEFNGMILNNWQFNIGVASELDSDVYLPVRDYRELVSIGFTSNHHLGFALMSMDWVARMETRGRRSR